MADSTKRKPEQTRAQDEIGRTEPRLPHEHDESHDSQESPPREVIEQAYEDVQSGQEDTDLRASGGKRQKTVPPDER
ncbi:hypothetical protein CDO44_16535 [Pigmentiphaga sp. NML080357]|uniref:hypothetical protein n=1 Tax=Pigmentiphaga sp. NML080357 TaxID=2008675 RepID=UPI000B41C203|nr:hypothetical protein [Pigmentiphaga sp. NML080357]OVZ57981.1 hypothetical protein CDO44_16535 [Pigmentiphaga sp. NML080357]